MINKTSIVSLIFLLLLVQGCRRTGIAPEFQEEKAWDFLLQQCDLGPRNPGSDQIEKARSFFISHLQNQADTVLIQRFNYLSEIEGKEQSGVNIIARFGKNFNRRILLGAHYDTRPRADMDRPENQNQPIIGANDGASGVAILLHLAEILKTFPPGIGVDLVLFDGEDTGLSNQPETFCNGSRYFAQNPISPLPQEGIILDMVGDRILTLYIERYSFRYHPKLVYQIWKLAQKRGFDNFKMQIAYEIYDDHVPLNEIAGIPTIDIIDFQYPATGVNYWHTLQDTPNNCSSRSLYIVGQVIVDYIYGRNG